MAQAMFSLRVTLMEMYECGDLVDLPSAAIVAAASRIAQGGCQGRRSGGNAHFDQLTALEPPLTEQCEGSADDYLFILRTPKSCAQVLFALGPSPVP